MALGVTMRRLGLIVSIASVFCAALPHNADAQERNGFWIAFDIGAGSLGTSARGTVGSVFSNDRGWTGASGLGLGWSINPQLLAGVELRSMGWTWWVDGMEGELYGSNLSGILTYYPRATSGFYIKGGLGGTFLNMDVRGVDGSAGNSSRGFGITAGTGYDLYWGRGFWFTPAVNFLYGQSGDVVFSGDSVIRDWTHNRLDFTVGIKFN